MTNREQNKINISAPIRVYIRVIPLLLLVSYFLFFSNTIFAANIDSASVAVSPAVIDLKGLPRDIIERTIILENNNADRKLDIYASVFDISKESGQEEFLDPSRADKTASLANWLSISRGVIELNPQEKKALDLKIQVNLWAKPGIYHAVIYFSEGPNREEAEKNLASAAKTFVNFEVLEDIKERLQLKRFAPDKSFFTDFNASFSYEIENIGNRPLSFKGEIRIYRKNGEEIGTVKIGEEGTIINPDESKKFTAVWEQGSENEVSAVRKEGKSMGRLKAMLDVEYGASRKTLQDTAFFWIVPWKTVALAFFGSLMIVIILFAAGNRIFKRRYRAKFKIPH